MPPRSAKSNPLFTLYPLLFGLYPVLYLWSANSEQMPPFAVLRALLMALGLAGLVYGLDRLILRDTAKAALAASLFLLLFYSFGHVAGLLTFWPWMGTIKLLLVWVVLQAAGLLAIARLRRVPGEVHTIFSMVGLALVLAAGLPLLVKAADPSAAGSLAQIVSPSTVPQTPGQQKAAGSFSNDAAGPDVYYILIDTYARQDALLELGYDNTDFVRELESLGFIVDPCAQSNYDQTHSSMTATLNMNYLEALGVPIYADEPGERMADFEPRIKHSLVREQFEQRGYRFVTFKGTYPWLNIADSDLFYDPEAGLGPLEREEALNFQGLVFRTTMLSPLFDLARLSMESANSFPPLVLEVFHFADPSSSIFNTRPYQTYQNSLDSFEALSRMPAEAGPKFIYAHLFSAHIPFAFNADGTLRTSDREDLAGYLGSVEYTSRRMVEVVRTILRDSAAPPVIILQGDHGFSGEQNRAKILNALYLPDPADRAVWKSNTPVNTFRFLFNTLFGEAYEMLPERSYHTPAGKAYQFELVPPSCAP